MGRHSSCPITSAKKRALRWVLRKLGITATLVLLGGCTIQSTAHVLHALPVGFRSPEIVMFYRDSPIGCAYSEIRISPSYEYESIAVERSSNLIQGIENGRPLSQIEPYDRDAQYVFQGSFSSLMDTFYEFDNFTYGSLIRLYEESRHCIGEASRNDQLDRPVTWHRQIMTREDGSVILNNSEGTVRVYLAFPLEQQVIYIGVLRRPL